MTSKTLVAAIAIVGFFSVADVAVADVAGSSIGVWNDLSPASSLPLAVGVGTSNLFWGNGSPTNSISFVGTAFSVPLETTFKLGTVSFFNGSITAGDISSVDLVLTTTFASSTLAPISNSYTFDHVSTPNTADPIASADYLFLPTLFGTTSFFIDDIQYQLKLIGFDDVVGDGFLQSSATEFHVLENASASADLIGIVTLATVPEPGSVHLMLIGLIAFALTFGRSLKRINAEGIM